MLAISNFLVMQDAYIVGFISLTMSVCSCNTPKLLNASADYKLSNHVTVAS